MSESLSIIDDSEDKKLIDRTIDIDGVLYYDLETFAELTKRSVASLRILMSKGNRLRKLKFKKIQASPFIPQTELFDFPFCFPGRSKMVMRFDTDGKEHTETIL